MGSQPYIGWTAGAVSKLFRASLRPQVFVTKSQPGHQSVLEPDGPGRQDRGRDRKRVVVLDAEGLPDLGTGSVQQFPQGRDTGLRGLDAPDPRTKLQPQVPGELRHGKQSRPLADDLLLGLRVISHMRGIAQDFECVEKGARQRIGIRHHINQQELAAGRQQPGQLRHHRKRVEEIFGWMKTVGILRRTCCRDVARTGLAGYLVATAYHLARMAHLPPEPEPAAVPPA